MKSITPTLVPTVGLAATVVPDHDRPALSRTGKTASGIAKNIRLSKRRSLLRAVVLAAGLLAGRAGSAQENYEWPIPSLSAILDHSQVTLSWDSVPGLTYGIQIRDPLTSGTWSTIANVGAADCTTTWTDPSAVAGCRFYQLLLPGGPNSLWEAPPEPPLGEPGDGTPASDGASGLPFLYPFSGEFHYSVEDLRIKGRGLDFVWARKYRSRVCLDTAQGHGWDFSYNIRIEHSGPNVVVFDGNSRADVYRPQPDGTYAANQFFRVGSFVGGVFTLTFADTGTWRFRPLDGSPARGKIEAITDHNGSALRFNYGGDGRLSEVLDTLNRSIQIAYNAAGLIASVRDFTGRTVTYNYYQNGEPGGAFGDLKSVTSSAVIGTPNGNNFPQGKTTTYTYSTGSAIATLNHNLLTITNPKGQTWLQNLYAATTDPTDLNFDRVISQTLGNTGEVQMLTYARQTPAVSNNFAVLKAILNDRLGNVSEYLYDAGNRCVNRRAFTGRAVPGVATTEVQNRPTNKLRPSDPDFFETRMEWNLDSKMTRMVYPNGNSTECVYESALDPNAQHTSRGNLRTRTQLPGPLGGDQASIVERWEYSAGMGGFNFVARVVDGRGNETLHSYDPHGNRIHTQHRIPSIVEDWEYNTFGQMTAHVLPDNGSGHRRRDEYFYGAPYLTRQVVDAGGFNLETFFDRDAVGNIFHKRDPRGNETQYAVNALDQIVRETSPEVQTLGGLVQYTRDTFYDANNNVVRVDVANFDDQGTLQPNSYFSTITEYEILNYPIRLIQENGSANLPNTVFTWAQINALGLGSEFTVTEFGLDANRNQILIRYPLAVDGTDPSDTEELTPDERDLGWWKKHAPGSANQSSTQFDYDGNGNLFRVSEGIENAPRISISVLDGYNRVTSSTDPMGNVMVMHYDANGNVTVRRLNGETNDVPGSAGNLRLSDTGFTYDPMDRSTQAVVAFFDTQTQSPIGNGVSIKRIFYNDISQPILVEDANGHQTRMTYDAANRLDSITDAKGNTIRYTYDANGNVTTVTETDRSDMGSADQITSVQNQLDALNRLVQKGDNLGNTHRYGYDSRDNQTTYIDARGNTVRNLVDGLNRITDTIRMMTANGDGNGAVIGSIITRQIWDRDSRLEALIDDNGNATTYEYDSLHRKTAQRNADSTVHTFRYDVHGNLIQTTDPNGNSVVCGYDLNNRLAFKTITPGPGVATNITYEHYSHDGAGRTTHADNNVSVVTFAYNSLSLATTETCQILPAGPVRTVNCTYDPVGNEVSIGYPGGRVVLNTRDPLNRKATVSDAGGVIANYSYIGPSRVERRDYGNGTRTEFGYDAIRRPAGIGHHTLAGAPIDYRTFQWDRMNNKTGMVANLTPPFDNRNYGYDSAGRLDHSANSGPSPANVDYQLDGVGNRTQVTGNVDPGSYTMDHTLPEPNDFAMNQYTATSFDTRTYDRNGNLTRSGTRQYGYDYRDELTGTFMPPAGQPTTFKYDCFGRRVEKATGAVVSRFYYHGSQEIEEQNSANTTVATFVWGNGIDELLEMTRNGQSSYFHADDLGSIVAATDAGGSVVERYSYGDYGQPTFFNGVGNPIGQSFIGNPYLFTGRRYDPETGWYSYGARYLDSRAGRFTTPDPIGSWRDPINLGNSFTYVGANPTSFTDPVNVNVTSDSGTDGPMQQSWDDTLGYHGQNMGTPPVYAGLGSWVKILIKAVRLSAAEAAFENIMGWIDGHSDSTPADGLVQVRATDLTVTCPAAEKKKVAGKLRDKAKELREKAAKEREAGKDADADKSDRKAALCDAAADRLSN